MKPKSNMNTTVKPETLALWKFVPFSLRVCLRGVALLGAVAVGFAQTPGPSSSPTPSPDGQTQINTNATELAEAEPTPKISAAELDSLVGPIALYPDSLLVQTLAASTY